MPDLACKLTFDRWPLHPAPCPTSRLFIKAPKAQGRDRGRGMMDAPEQIGWDASKWKSAPSPSGRRKCCWDINISRPPHEMSSFIRLTIVPGCLSLCLWLCGVQWQSSLSLPEIKSSTICSAKCLYRHTHTHPASYTGRNYGERVAD